MGPLEQCEKSCNERINGETVFVHMEKMSTGEILAEYEGVPFKGGSIKSVHDTLAPPLLLQKISKKIACMLCSNRVKKAEEKCRD